MPPKEPAAAAAEPRASVALRVLVVNEPGVAEAINRLRGEWAERSGGELSATSRPWKEVAGAKSIEADVVIFPIAVSGRIVHSRLAATGAVERAGRRRVQRRRCLSARASRADEVGRRGDGAAAWRSIDAAGHALNADASGAWLSWLMAAPSACLERT